MPGPLRANVSLDSGRYGDIGASGLWREIIQAYYHDEVKAAWETVQHTGADFAGQMLDWGRMIEGEGVARENGTIREVSPTLKVETIDAEVGHVDLVSRTVEAASKEVAARLGWNFEVPVMATILPAEVDAPWHSARYGYAMDKYPYDKICLPRVSTADEAHLHAVAAHEFAHVVTINRSGNRAPEWVEEGISTLMEGRPEESVSIWRDPKSLNEGFNVDRRDSSTLHGVGDAYAQARRLIGYLHAQKGDEGLRAFLHAFTNNGLWTEIKINVFGEPSVEEALHEVYGLSQNDLFAAARGTG